MRGRRLRRLVSQMGLPLLPLRGDQQTDETDDSSDTSVDDVPPAPALKLDRRDQLLYTPGCYLCLNILLFSVVCRYFDFLYRLFDFALVWEHRYGISIMSDIRGQTERQKEMRNI